MHVIPNGQFFQNSREGSLLLDHNPGHNPYNKSAYNGDNKGYYRSEGRLKLWMRYYIDVYGQPFYKCNEDNYRREIILILHYVYHQTLYTLTGFSFVSGDCMRTLYYL